MDDILGDIFDSILEVEPVAMPVQRPLVALFKANLVYTVAELKLLRILWDSVQALPANIELSFILAADQQQKHPHQPLPVRDSANKPTTRLHPLRNVRQHRPDLLFALESVVHAKLQRDNVERRCDWRQDVLRQDIAEQSGVTVSRGEVRGVLWWPQLGVAHARLVNGYRRDI